MTHMGGGAKSTAPLAQQVVRLLEKAQLQEQQIAELNNRMHTLEVFIHGEGEPGIPVPAGPIVSNI